MISDEPRRSGQAEPTRLLAFHYSAGYENWNSLAGHATAPALVYEVTETTERSGSVLYEGRIFDAATAEMIHERPYQSTFLEAFARWWSRETELEPPHELLSYGDGSGVEPDQLDYGGKTRVGHKRCSCKRSFREGPLPDDADGNSGSGSRRRLHKGGSLRRTGDGRRETGDPGRGQALRSGRRACGW